MTIDSIRLRNEFINTQVITRNNGTRLGVVKDVLVDIDRREVVSLGLRDSMFSVSGMPKYMYLDTIIRTGDVVLVEDEDVLADVDVEAYSPLINSEVITEAGEPLGRVRDFQFDLESGTVSSLIIASLGLPQIPEQVISTYELPIEEVISSGPNRLIVFEGAEERLSQITVGFLERLGIGRPPWEREEEDLYYAPTARPENQLGTGVPLQQPVARPPVEARQPIDNWDEDEWQEEPIAPPPPRRQKAQAMSYDDYEEDNWGGDSGGYEDYNESPRSYTEQDVDGDVWDDDVKEEPYTPPVVNMPEQTKEYEYKEETNY
ncbi:PRC-barrel domain-containing protein [[Limnothrix rosea] IAM M-220]|uniref:PRC-barrel domain-containing protein n=1 Tax=[Limnothrix rosea] IAM M-220 TaxID=454133 RepID=UPI00095CF1C4|nr:PRC-barrel domain-containing protein [[Limnothrix rosea] IAM M-220]OKH17444.1 photosystem reaction center subunit H [[Limnothrix rosea] IAM M-220]